MTSSTFHVTDVIDQNDDDPLTLFIGPDGTVTPDKETVKRILSNRSSIDINLMTMKKVDAGEVNVLLDNLKYVNREAEMQDPQQEMTELARNLHNFRMDHDYTPFTSPSHVPATMDMVDELAATLSMLEDGSLDPQLTNEPLTKITKIVKGRKQTIFVNSKEKQRMINAGLLKEKATTEKVFKKPKAMQTRTMTRSQANAMEEEEEEEEHDEDYTMEEEEDAHEDVEEESKPEPETTARTMTPPPPSAAKPVVIVPPKEEPPPSVADRKVPVRKEKKMTKPPAPIPDDTALFSAPDIIRRVGREPASPAKITPENRSKSSAEKPKRLSADAPDRIRRMSLDPSTIPTNEQVVPAVNKSEEQVSVQEFSETLSNSNESISDEQLEPLPSAEDIRAMIHNEHTKSFTINSVLPEVEETTSDLPLAEGTGIAGLDAASLDLDQSILDNINTDLISEDMLYQVAQSLVDNNTELQNVIDKSLTDGNLHLDADSSSTGTAANASATLSQSNLITPVEQNNQIVPPTQSRHEASPGATQIVRPDGRIVLIPPIERPATRSRNKKHTAIATSTIKPKPLEDAHVAGAGSENERDDDADEQEESDDDPNKLWCVCNQPHNNRFMICCDTCEEWYHGKCVNVTKAMGHTMEQQGKEWMCVYCKDPKLKRPKAALRRMRKASKTSTESGKPAAKSKSTKVPSSKQTASPQQQQQQPPPPPPQQQQQQRDRDKKPGCVVCGKPSRSSSIYCSDTCILKHAQGVEKVVVFNRKTGHLLSGSNAPSAASLDKWLLDNPSYEVVRSSSKMGGSAKTSKPTQLTQSKLKIVKNASTPGVSLAVQKKGGISIGVLQHSPKPPPPAAAAAKSSPPIVLNSSVKSKSLVGSVSGLKVVSKPTTNQPSSPASQETTSSRSKGKLVSGMPITKGSVASPVHHQKSKVSTQPTPKKEKDGGGLPMPQKTPKARQAEFTRQPKQENLRETVKKTFFEQLSNRLKMVDDLKLSDDELRQVSDEIESQLYKCFADTGQKYRNKYRSLIFNIKDPKNQTLWRRICEKSVNPYQLVRLSHDDLASQELALWRERETKHQLDMIKKSELELLNCSRQYVFKTHKGETVFEDDRGKDQVTDVIASAVNDSIGQEGGDVEPAADDAASKGGISSNKQHSSRRDRDRKRRSRSKERKRRSRSRDRSSRHSERRRSRSRDRHRGDRHKSHKSSRHKKDDDGSSARKERTLGTDKLDKKSKEILEQLVDKQIVPPLEDTVWKQEEVVMPVPPPPPPPQVTESDSDHEPSSTVTIPTPPRVNEADELPQAVKKSSSSSSPEQATEIVSPQVDTVDDVSKLDVDERVVPEDPKHQAPLWTGAINMIDVANIAISAYEVTGDCAGLGEELPKSLDIVGRISPSTVWDYIGKMRTSNSKTISVLRLTASSMEERAAYLSLYSYLSSRQRLGVVKCGNKRVKDFYILPLAAHSPIPEAILPLTGPGFEDARPSLLAGVIVRDKRKRTHDIAAAVGASASAAAAASGHQQSKRIRVEVVSAPVNKAPSTPPRSYTPPPTRDPRIKLPVPTVDQPEDNDDEDEPYSPADSDPDNTMPDPKSQLNASDLSSLLSAGVKASSFLETGITQPATFEPFSSKFEGIPGLDVTPTTLPSSSLELEQKMAELDQKIAAQKAEIDKVSKDLVSSGSSDLEAASLANIALPSNLQQILESIKSIGNKSDTCEYQPESGSMTGSATTDLTIPLMLPKLSSRPIASGSPSSVDSASIPLNLPKKQKAETTGSASGGSVLSSLSEEDLIKKAAEMLGESEPSPPPPKAKKGRLELNQPPIPGLED